MNGLNFNPQQMPNQLPDDLLQRLMMLFRDSGYGGLQSSLLSLMNANGENGRGSRRLQGFDSSRLSRGSGTGGAGTGIPPTGLGAISFTKNQGDV